MNDLLRQIGEWHENNEHKKIIDAIETLPREQWDYDLICLLARAYNNVTEGPGPRPEKAINLLHSVAEQGKTDALWNFRLGYAFHLLEWDAEALFYFQRAAELNPDDVDAPEFIDKCRHNLTLPRFRENFRERTEKTWRAFAEGEGELRRLLDEKDRCAVQDELLEKCNQILKLAFDDTAFELGVNEGKYELILSPEGNRAKLFELVYFRQHAPAAVLERWNIHVGCQPGREYTLHAFNWEVSAQDVQVWVEKTGEQKVGLTAYCEKLTAPLKEDKDRDKVWWMLPILIHQVLGEVTAMSLIGSFDILDAPRQEPSIPLPKLPGVLKEMGMRLNLNPWEYLDNSYISYQMEPTEDMDADWRLDVFAGSTRCSQLINEYLSGDTGTMDALHRDGAVAGFLCFPLDGFTGEERGKQILDFRDGLEAYITEQFPDAATFLGGASGIYCGYLDFIAWDLPRVLGAATTFFKRSPLAWASFHTFRRVAGTVGLYDSLTV